MRRALWLAHSIPEMGLKRWEGLSSRRINMNWNTGSTKFLSTVNYRLNALIPHGMSINGYDDCIPSPCQACMLEMESLETFPTFEKLRVYDKD